MVNYNNHVVEIVRAILQAPAFIIAAARTLLCLQRAHTQIRRSHITRLQDTDYDDQARSFRLRNGYIIYNQSYSLKLKKNKIYW